MLIALGTLTGLIVILSTAVNPVGTAIGFVLSSVAMTGVVLAYLWLDRWEPEPPRLLVLAFIWGASVAVVVSAVLGLFVDSLINSGGTEGVSVASVVIGAPVIEEAAKGLFLVIMMTGRRRNELNSMTDCLVYAGLAGAGFAWLEDILYISSGGSLGESLLTAAMRLIMAPFAHSLFTTMIGIGVYFALQQRTRVGQGRVHPARLPRCGDHARALERIGAAERADLFPGLHLLDGADLRAGDRTRRRQPPPGAASRRRQAARHGGGRPRDPQ